MKRSSSRLGRQRVKVLDGIVLSDLSLKDSLSRMKEGGRKLVNALRIFVAASHVSDGHRSDKPREEQVVTRVDAAVVNTRL